MNEKTNFGKIYKKKTARIWKRKICSLQYGVVPDELADLTCEK